MKMYNPRVAPGMASSGRRRAPEPGRGRGRGAHAAALGRQRADRRRCCSTSRRSSPAAPTAAYPALNRTYPHGLRADTAYVATLPDLQNGPDSLIKGAKTDIQHVGISNFRLPIRFRTRAGGEVQLETSVTGSVSLEADRKGINMSRIMRSFYRHAETSFSFEVIGAVLDSYLDDLDSFDARIMMRLQLPDAEARRCAAGSRATSTTTSRWRWCARTARRQRIVHLDYVYSSTCPCSLELSEHARRTRGQIATPHSQRSVARVSVELVGDEVLWFEDLVDLCNAAIPTETQVMVKREDEQAFAELNGANPIFVEDAVRLLCESLAARRRASATSAWWRATRSRCTRHDAVSILTMGETFRPDELRPAPVREPPPPGLNDTCRPEGRLTRANFGIPPPPNARYRRVRRRGDEGGWTVPVRRVSCVASGLPSSPSPLPSTFPTLGSPPTSTIRPS